MVERWFEEPEVGASKAPLGTILFNAWVAER